MIEHRAAANGPADEQRIGGWPVFSAEQHGEDPRHPTVLARWPNLLVGLAAEDDIFRVHHRAFAPGESHTLEWSIYPLIGTGGDGVGYFDFINAVRNNWGSNYTLPQPSTFISVPDYKALTADDCETWTRQRGVVWQCSNQTVHKDNSLAEGTDIPNAKYWCDSVRQRLQSRVPEAKVLVYLHGEICTEPGAAEKYADSRHLRSDGSHLVTLYHYPVYMYLSTLDNSYGKALQQTVKFILHDIGADGIYLDEFLPIGEAKYAYDAAWDGCTVMINPKTHAVTRKRSSAVLLQMPWRAWLIDYCRANDKLIIGNSPPMTRTLLRKHVPRFTETNSHSFITYGHLAVPWGLGDDTPTMARRAYRARRFLDHAGVFNPYPWNDEVAEQRIPFPASFYPITPLQLRPGMVLGKERIITNRSGRYRFADGEVGRVLLFDASGYQVEREANGERDEAVVRMPSDHFAVIERAY